jgi:YihY family inner membrane protein
MLETLRRALGRVFPGCVTVGQAVAFNMFLAFFPVLLFTLGILSNFDFFHGGLRELPDRLHSFLPPGSEHVMGDYFATKELHPWRWIWLGLGGMLFAGTQVLIGLVQGFRIIEEIEPRLSYTKLQIRAFGLFSLTMIPWLAFVFFTVFGRPMRNWITSVLGLGFWVRWIVAGIYHGLALLVALAVLIVIYRLGQPAMIAIRDVLPGATVATVLWWIVDIGFGFYVRIVPYGTVYRGLAAAIGLLVWMYMTAMVLFIGAAYNAVSFEEDHGPISYRTLT